ncbi:hypothetical protein CYLTODRAFT_418817 [Cylindrobasidium torrendii FP15055 ss-10]|uniref:Uncharacterized protein n=1 Tax=Cylindrobasidium torrendii FP15055 ss-10 TaxID=1314674 RepID=A0A0D7BMJ0_9AGAR|nr:hypothetical protein CYLTODRAFT_418817 [Cylindrobasidium torrendii FP15055 ss-10]
MSHLQRNDTLAGPPPAYRLSDQEFDAKTANAVEASLRNPPASPPTGTPGYHTEDTRREEHGGWPRRPRGPSASRPLGARALPSPPIGQLGQTSPSIQPLNIRKKKRSVSSMQSGGSSAVSDASASHKERPSWYAEAGLGEGSSSAQSVSSGASSSYAGQPQSGRFVIHNPAEDEDTESDAPPPFSAVGPSSSGPHFEELRWDPQQEPPSVPAAPSLPVSPAMSSVTLPPTRPASSMSASSQVPLRPPSSVSSRPMQQQRLSFGAYGAPERAVRAPTTYHTPDRNALSLYSSSVAPHVISTPPRQSYSSSRQTQSQARQSWISMPMPTPVSPTPTYPAQDFTNYPLHHSNPNSQRWATSEHELSWS